MPLGSQPAPLREPVCFGCSDRTVAGTLSAGTEGFSAARDVTIEPAGVLNANSATLEIAGDWDNTGTFNAGTSSVNFVDGCGVSLATISGETSFSTLTITTATGKTYQLEARPQLAWVEPIQ